MPTLSLAIQKGGSGKTTTAVNLAAALKQVGKSVLLVDMDPQANLTQALGIRELPALTLYHLLQQEANGQEARVREALLATPAGLDLLPASLELANAELELVSVYGRENILKSLLKPLVPAYDYILIDCPPAIGMLTVNALVASDTFIMPMVAEFFSLMGARSFMKAADRIRRMNTRLTLTGIVLTLFDERKIMNRQVMEQLQAEFPGKVFGVKIRRSIALAHSQEKGQTIFQYDQVSNGAMDYLQLAAELLERMKKTENEV